MIWTRLVSLALAIVVLLAACSPTRTEGAIPPVGQAQGAGQPAATSTPYPTYAPYPTYTPLPTEGPTSTPEPTAVATATETPVPAEESVEPPAQLVPGDAPVAPAAPSLYLERIPVSTPGAPFTILVDDVRIEEDGNYKVTGRVRNDGTEIYEGIGVHGTFFDAQEGRYGPVSVHCPCPFLEPGAECPFSLEIYPRDYVAYQLHPKGQPVGHRQPAAVTFSGLDVSNDGIGNVRITGTVVNENVFTVRNATVAGALVDASGRIVSVGSTIVLGEIAPGDRRPFDLRVEYEAYSYYLLYAQATQS